MGYRIKVSSSEFGSECVDSSSATPTNILNMEKTELEKLIVNDGLSYEAIGRIYGVTGAAIKKRAKKMGIKISPRIKVNPNQNFSHLRYKDFLCCPVCGKSFRRTHKDSITCSGECGRKYHVELRMKEKEKQKELSKWDGVERKNMWKIEGRVRSNGYIWAKCPNHPNAFKDGYVLEHRIVVENNIGRLLRKDELVHHIDGNKTNNNISNLLIVSASEHTRIHANERILMGVGIANRNRRVARGKETRCGRFDEGEIIEIRNQYKDGRTCAEMAQKYNVSDGAIRQIIQGRTYKWVNR